MTALPLRARWSTQASLPDALVSTVLASGSSTDLECLASHPSVPVGAQHALLSTSAAPALLRNPVLDPSVQASVFSAPAGSHLLSLLVRNPNLTAALQRQVVASYSFMTASLLENPALVPELRDELLGSLGPCTTGCHCASLAAACPGVPLSRDHEVALLESHPDAWAALARRTDLAPELLAAMAAAVVEFRRDGREPLAQRDLLRRGAFPDAFLEELLASEDREDLADLACADLPRPVAEHLLEDLLALPSWPLLALLAGNESLPGDLQARLATRVWAELKSLPGSDPSRLHVEQVHYHLTCNAAFFPDLLPTYLAGVKAGAPAYSLAWNTSLPLVFLSELLEVLLVDPEAHARPIGDLASNAGLPLGLEHPAGFAYEYRPAELFALADDQGLEPEAFDTMVVGFTGTVGELFEVVRDVSS